MTWNKEKDIFYLAVGHGTQINGVWDSGCAYGNYTEAKLMLPIVQTAVKYLRKSGVRVLTDADTQNDKNMTACVAKANAEKATLYMSIHCDYKDAKAGVAPLYVSSTGKTMATTVGKIVAKRMGMKWRGAFKRTDLHELNATDMPAVIFETGAIKADLKYLKDYKRYGKALAVGILNYIGVPMFKHSNAWKLRSSAKSVTAYMKRHKFKYKHSHLDCAVTWKGARLKRTTNCSMMVSYALQRKKLLKPGQFFWINGDHITCKGGLTLKQLKKIAVIKHPHKPPKKAGLKKGDIVGYPKTSEHGAHTMIFAGWDGNTPLWYSTGGTADIKSGKAHAKGGYTKEKIYTIIRLK